MQPKYDNQKTEQLLLKICSSKTFSNSPRNVRLLKFLVAEALAGRFVKEHTIGTELFKSKYNANNNTGKVRVYMFNLRKKLEEYYQNEGQSDELVFAIEKGQYNLKFKQQTIKTEQNWFARNRISLFITAGIVIINTLIFIFWNANKQKETIWSGFFKPNEETICVISDHFVMNAILPDGTQGTIRNPAINNEREMSAYLKQHKDLQLSPTDFSFMTKMAPLAIKNITRWFTVNQKDFSIRIESRFTYDELRNKNLLFIGQFKTMSGAKALFLKNSEVFTIKENSFLYKKNDLTHKYQSSFAGSSRVDYAMVSLMHLDNGKSALFFCSNNDIGVIATVSNFTDPTWLKQFQQSLPAQTHSFNALFKVSGVGRTELNCSLEQIETFNEF